MQIGSVVDIGNQNGVPNRAYAIEAIDILRSFADFGDLTIDTPIGSIDGINKSFTLQFSPETAIITVNGIVVTNFTISDNTLLFVDAPPVGSEIRAYYNINGSLGITVETPTGDVDGINRIFSITKKPNTAIVTVNGIVVTNFILSGGRVLFVTAPPAGSEIRVYYNFGETVSVSIPNLSELNDVSGVPSEDFQMYAWRTATSRFQLVNPITGLKEPTGLNPIPTLSVVGSVLNITGSHTAWFRGEKYDKSTQTLEMSGFANGVWFVYYNSLGVLSSSQTPWSITDTIPIAIVYKNGTSYRLYDERHGTVMDSVTHQYLHETRGTAYIGGLAASFADTSLNLTSGSYADEDIKISITGANPFQVAIMYRNASLNWVWSSLQSNWWLVGTSGRPRYDNAGVLTDLASNQFGVYYIVATNDLTSPIVSLMGQAAYGTRAAARAASFNDLSFGTLPTPEFKVLYKVIVDATSSSGAFAESQDFRTNIQIPGAAPVLTSHSSLSGLTSDDHPQYALLNGRVGDVYTLAEVAEPTTASSGFGRLYIDSADSKIKFKDDAGIVFDLTSGGGGGGTILGSGAANYLAKFTASDTIGNSAIVENGTSVIVGTSSSTRILYVNGLISTEFGLNLVLVAAPTAASGVLVPDSDPAHIPVGGHVYRVTYYTALGETSGGVPSSVITTDASNCSIQLTIPISSDVRVIGRKIYRNKINYVGSDVMYLLTTIANNTSTSYLDSSPDTALGTDGYAILRANTTSSFIAVDSTRSVIIGNSATVIGLSTAIMSTASLGRTTIYGYSAGRALTSGFANTLIGYSCGDGITTGGSNTAIGASAILRLTIGSGNVAIGEQANLWNQTGSQNTVVGFGALQGAPGFNQSENTIIGGRTGNTNTGNRNTFIGCYSNSTYYPYPSPTTTISDSIAIGYGSTNSKNGQAVIGHPAFITETLLNGNVGIGKTPAYKLDIDGDINISSGYYFRINTNSAIYQSGTLFQFGWLGLGTSTRVYFGAISDGTAAIYTANTQRMAVLVTGEFQIFTSLQVNTINEYTATNGVSIDGVLLKDGFVRLTKIVEPSIPAAGYALIYSDSGDSILKYKNSDGAVWDLSSNKHQIILNATPSVNQTADGIKTYLTAGTNMSFGTIVYINSTAGSVYGADANVASTTPAIGILLSSTSTGNPVEVLLHGIVRNDLWNWTVGGKLYLSETSGELTQTVPTTSGATIQVMGIATHADRILFNPSNDTILLS